MAIPFRLISNLYASCRSNKITLIEFVVSGVTDLVCKIPGKMIMQCHRLDVTCVDVAMERYAVLDSSVKGAKLETSVKSA